MSLQKRMNAYNKDFEAKAPVAALAVMHRVTKELGESGILNRTVKVGDMAPDFVLKDTKGYRLRTGRCSGIRCHGSESDAVFSGHR